MNILGLVFWTAPNTKIAQAEANSIVVVRLGSFACGIGTQKQVYGRNRKGRWNPFPFIFSVWRPIIQNNRREVFKIGFRRIYISFTTKGDE